MASLDDDVKALDGARTYAVSVSATLEARQRDAINAARTREAMP
jgi:hypothetical protein